MDVIIIYPYHDINAGVPILCMDDVLHRIYLYKCNYLCIPQIHYWFSQYLLVNIAPGSHVKKVCQNKQNECWTNINLPNEGPQEHLVHEFLYLLLMQTTYNILRHSTIHDHLNVHTACCVSWTYEDMCARIRYQGQGHVITSHRYCGV